MVIIVIAFSCLLITILSSICLFTGFAITALEVVSDDPANEITAGSNTLTLKFNLVNMGRELESSFSPPISHEYIDFKLYGGISPSLTSAAVSINIVVHQKKTFCNKICTSCLKTL